MCIEIVLLTEAIFDKYEQDKSSKTTYIHRKVNLLPEIRS